MCRLVAAVIAAAILISIIDSTRNDAVVRNRIESLKISEELSPGERLPQIEVPIIFPRPGKVTIPQPGEDLLVMFYSGKCVSCRESWPVWDSIAVASPRLRAVHTLAISVLDEETTRKELPDREHKTPVGLFVRTAAATAYKVHRLPAVIYVRNGTVEAAWYGAIGHQQRIAIMRRIAGLDEAATKGTGQQRNTPY